MTKRLPSLKINKGMKDSRILFTGFKDFIDSSKTNPQGFIDSRKQGFHNKGLHNVKETVICSSRFNYLNHPKNCLFKIRESV